MLSDHVLDHLFYLQKEVLASTCWQRYFTIKDLGGFLLRYFLLFFIQIWNSSLYIIIANSQNICNMTGWEEYNIGRKKWNFPITVSSVNGDLVIFTEGILNGKLHFLCTAILYSLSHFWQKMGKNIRFLWKENQNLLHYNRFQTHNHLVCKRSLIHLAKLVECLLTN